MKTAYEMLIIDWSSDVCSSDLPEDHRPRGRPEADAEFARDDLCQRRLAESGRPDEEDVIERFGAGAGGADEDLQILAHRPLADEVVQRLRPQRQIGAVAGGVLTVHRSRPGFGGHPGERKSVG